MTVGGQAVIEGVMMRSKERYAVAVRMPDGSIKVKRETSKFPKYFRFPFIRGVVGLAYTLIDGIKALVWSGNQQEEDVDEKLTKKEIVLTVFFSFIFSVLFFVAVPFFAARLIHSEGVLFDIIDGLFRFVLFLGYLYVISKFKDVKRIFEYHGAEHKTIAAHEAGAKLTPSSVEKFSRFHPRCGTSFLFLVMIIAIVVFALVPGNWVVALISRILLIPVIASIGYELIKISGSYPKNFFVKIISAPGLWLQRITTKEPDHAQIEVAIKSLEAVLD